MIRLSDLLPEADSSTERVRRYYKRHPKKVTAHLRKTQDDRVARNRDRRKAVKKYGEEKMAKHDVHHHDGKPQNGNWRLAKKDHGPGRLKSKKEGIDKKEDGYYSTEPEFSHLMAGSKNKNG